jgi:hypothetical protein
MKTFLVIMGSMIFVTIVFFGALSLILIKWFIDRFIESAEDEEDFYREELALIDAEKKNKKN